MPSPLLSLPYALQLMFAMFIFGIYQPAACSYKLVDENGFSECSALVNYYKYKIPEYKIKAQSIFIDEIFISL